METKSYGEIVMALKKIKYWDLLKEMAPEGMVVCVDSHDTATHCRIYLEMVGQADLLVWYKTVWYNSCYEFNEKGKIQGIQPGCEFISAKLNALFDRAFAAIEERERENQAHKTKEKETDEREYQNKLNAYREKFAGY